MNNPDYPIIVVGSYNQDLTWYTDEFPSVGETTTGRFATSPGGKGANQAVAARRSGGKVGFVGAIGNDAFGNQARMLFESEHIFATWIEKPEAPTGNAGIIVDKNSDNKIVVALGANNALLPQDLPLIYLQRARILLCQLEIPSETVAYALSIAKNAGVTTLLNPAPMSTHFNAALLKDVDILTPNTKEFSQLIRGKVPADAVASTADPTLHDLCRSLGSVTVLITLGSKGVFLSTKKEYKRFPIEKLVQAIDSTGAGDAFNGGFATGFVESNGDIPKAIRFGMRVAALSVTRRGAIAAMPCRQEIDRFFQ